MANTHSIDWELSSSQSASITDASQTGLDITGDITIEGYFNFESLPTSDIFTIAGKWGDGSNSQAAYLFDYQHDGANAKLRFLQNDGAGNDTLTKNITAPTTGVWVHLAAAWTASTTTAEFFVDGVSQGTSVGSNTSTSNTAAAFEVSVRQSTDFFDGKMNNLRIWSSARSAAQVLANKDLVLTSGPVSSWYSTDNHNDNIGSNNLTAANAPVFSTDVPFTDATGNFFALL